MRNAIYEFDPEVFPLMLFVVITDSNEFLKDQFRTVKGEVPEMAIGENDGNTFYYVQKKDTGRRGIIIQLSNPNTDVEIFAHEAYHYAKRLFEYCNDEGSNETYALLTGWATKCVDKAAKEYQAETNRLHSQGVGCSGDVPTIQKKDIYGSDFAKMANGTIQSANPVRLWTKLSYKKPNEGSYIYVRRINFRGDLPYLYGPENINEMSLLGSEEELEWSYQVEEQGISRVDEVEDSDTCKFNVIKFEKALNNVLAVIQELKEIQDSDWYKGFEKDVHQYLIKTVPEIKETEAEENTGSTIKINSSGRAL